MTHTFDMRCEENGIEQRLTRIKHPWANGQVERMNRTIKETTVKRYHYDTHRQLENHLTGFIAAYSYARRLKTLRGLTPYEFICKLGPNSPSALPPTRTTKLRDHTLLVVTQFLSPGDAPIGIAKETDVDLLLTEMMLLRKS